MEKIVDSLNKTNQDKKNQLEATYLENAKWLQNEFALIRKLIQQNPRDILLKTTNPTQDISKSAVEINKKRKSSELIALDPLKLSPEQKRCSGSISNQQAQANPSDIIDFESWTTSQGLPFDFNKLKKETILMEMEKRGNKDHSMKTTKIILVESLKAILHHQYLQYKAANSESESNEILATTVQSQEENSMKSSSGRKVSLMADFRALVISNPPSDSKTTTKTSNEDNETDNRIQSEYLARQVRHRDSQFRKSQVAATIEVSSQPEASPILTQLETKPSTSAGADAIEDDHPQPSVEVDEHQAETDQIIIEEVQPNAEAPTEVEERIKDQPIQQPVVNMMQDITSPIAILKEKVEKQFISSIGKPTSTAPTTPSAIHPGHTATGTSITSEEEGATFSNLVLIPIAAIEPSSHHDILTKPIDPVEKEPSTSISVQAAIQNLNAKINPQTNAVANVKLTKPIVNSSVNPIKTTNPSVVSNLVTSSSTTSFLEKPGLGPPVKKVIVVPALEKAKELKAAQDLKVQQKKAEQKMMIVASTSTVSSTTNSSSRSGSPIQSKPIKSSTVPPAATNPIPSSTTTTTGHKVTGAGGIMRLLGKKPTNPTVAPTNPKSNVVNQTTKPTPTTIPYPPIIAVSRQGPVDEAKPPVLKPDVENHSEKVVTTSSSSASTAASLLTSPSSFKSVVSKIVNAYQSAKSMTPNHIEPTTSSSTTAAENNENIPTTNAIPITQPSSVQKVTSETNRVQPLSENKALLEQQKKAVETASDSEDEAAGGDQYPMVMDDDDSETGTEDEEEDKEANKKAEANVPDWAKGNALKDALERQYGLIPGLPPMDPDTIFHEVTSCSLEEIFGIREQRYKNRSSSAKWEADELTSIEKRSYRKLMGYSNPEESSATLMMKGSQSPIRSTVIQNSTSHTSNHR